MISEARFAQGFASFWREALPMGEEVVKFLNHQFEVFDEPMESDVEPRRRELTNEAGFRIFAGMVEDGKVAAGEPPAELIESACREATEFIRRFRRPEPAPLSPPTDEEQAEAVELASRLATFFRSLPPREPLQVWPEFAGCGIVKTCRGDLFAGRTLYEVKAGERSFRQVDLRQVFVYGALNYAEARHPLENVGFVNPRLGRFFEAELEQLVRNTTGRAAVELFADIVEFLASDRVSG